MNGIGMNPEEIKANAENIRLELLDLLSSKRTFDEVSIEHSPCCCAGRCDLLHMSVCISSKGLTREMVVYSSSERVEYSGAHPDWLALEERGIDLWRGSSLEAAAAFIAAFLETIKMPSAR